MKHSSAMKITVTAFCAAVNIAGAYLALALRLPIYLDSIGTILGSVLLGPVFGMITAVLSGVINGVTSDVYAFYFIPVGMITGLLAGFLFRGGWFHGWKLPLGALLLTIPGTAVSSCIAAFVFGGVTSSGSSLLVQALHRLGLGLITSTFLVQVLTDYLDRLISTGIVCAVVLRLGEPVKALLAGEKKHGAI